MTKNATIDNNIFSYEIITDKIKLVYIPESIHFFNNKSTNETIENGDILEKNYQLKIDKDFDNNNNYLEYQIMIIEAEYDLLNSNASEIINCSAQNIEFIDERDNYMRSIFFGRINTLIFINQSCHEYCETCSELGTSSNDQKCLTCKEEYSYFSPAEFTNNCIPLNKYYDTDSHNLIECTEENSYFYINEKNKKICFSNMKQCPDEYSILDLNTKECKKESSNNHYDISYSESDIIIHSNNNTINNINNKTYTNNINKINTNNCSYKNYLNNNCSIIFKDNEHANKYMLEILSIFEPVEDKSIYLTTENNMTFEITTIQKEKNELNDKSIRDNLTIIDIGYCENILRDSYDINENISLIFIKSENLNSIPSEKNVQYEIYESINKTKLNLSLCEGTDIHLYFPIQLNIETQQLYEDLNKQGYDLFNIKDKFYQDICTPYKSENGTDILLSDRINNIYYKNNNLTSCQENCEYSNYSSETKLLKCKCYVNTEPIDYENQKNSHLSNCMKVFMMC